MVKPGPLSPNDAAYINDQLRELEVLKRRVEGLLGQAPELIPAAVTSQTTVSWTTVVTGTTTTTYSVVQHGWYEEGHNVQGTRVTLIGGRTGTNLADPARTPSGSAITPAPTPTSPVRVWIRKVGLAGSHGMIHEVVSVAGGTSGTSGTDQQRFVSTYNTSWQLQTIASTAGTPLTTSVTAFSGLESGFRYQVFGALYHNLTGVSRSANTSTSYAVLFFFTTPDGTLLAESYQYADSQFFESGYISSFGGTVTIASLVVPSASTSLILNMWVYHTNQSGSAQYIEAFSTVVDLHLWRDIT